MKKIGIYVFSFLISLAAIFVPNCINQRFFADDGYVLVSSVEQFRAISGSGKYKLSQDIDFYGETYTPITSFSGELDGNGFSVKNISLTQNATENIALFASTDGATIKNLQLKGVNFKSDSVNEQVHIARVAAIVALAKSTTIQNCSVTYISALVNEILETTYTTVEVATNASIYAGAIAGELIDGSVIKNCYTDAVIKATQTGFNTLKAYYIGGIAGKVENSNIYNNIVKTSINLKSDVIDNAAVGGIAGYVSGNKTNIKNNIFVGLIRDLDVASEFLSPYVASFVGYISTPSDSPKNASIAYFRTNSERGFLGNYTLLLNNVQITGFNPDNIHVGIDLDISTFYRESYYDNADRWDEMLAWDFAGTWVISENIGLPSLQNFQKFTYTFSEEASFATLERPNMGAGVNSIEFENADALQEFEFGGTIYLSATMTSTKNINKFFEIVGLRKDRNDNIIYQNSHILAIIQNGVSQDEDEATEKVYVYGTDVLTVKTSSEDSVLKTEYILAGSDIIWKTFTKDGNFYNSYTILNCNASMRGEYSFLLSPIKYKLSVSTENIDRGSVRRGTADASSKNQLIEDYVTYGQRLSYVATPTDDYAFDKWIISTEDETGVEDRAQFNQTFDEYLFEENGIFEGLELGVDELLLIAKYTKNICEITFKFAVNNKLITNNLAKVFIDNIEVPEVNGVYSKKVKMGTTHTVRVVLVAGYEFTNWFESDGTNNIGDLSENLSFEVTANNESESLILVANFFKEESKTQNYTWVWILVGSVVFVALVVLVIILLRKGKDNSYKKYYY